MRKQSKQKFVLMLAVLLALQSTACGEKPEASSDVSTERTESSSEMPSADTEETVESTIVEETPTPEDPNAVKWDESGRERTMQEAVMRVKTGIFDRELTPEDLRKVTELEADGTAFDKLDWLAYLEDLTVLRLPGGNKFGVENLDFLSGMSGLLELDLSNGQGVHSYRFKDISGLSGLTNLTTLSLSCEGEADVSVLSELKNLTSLTLEGFDAEDLNVLSGLTNLTSLTLNIASPRDSGGQEHELDLSALSGLTNLESLVLSGDRGRICDISFLSGMNNLTVLRLSTETNMGLGTDDIGVLSGLTNLETLELNFNIDYSAWDGERGFTYYTRMYDISPLSGLTNLKNLTLGYLNAYIDLNCLSGLTNLEMLELHPISDVTENGGVIVHYGGDMSSLSGLTNLRTLLLKNQVNVGWKLNQIASIPALPNLTTLGVSLSHRTDISGEMRRLEAAGVLYLDPVQEDTPFPNLANLDTLIIYESDQAFATNLNPLYLQNLTTMIIEDRDAWELPLGEDPNAWKLGLGPERVWPNLTTLTLTSGTGAEEWNSDWNARFPKLEALTLNGYHGDLTGLPELTALTLHDFNGEVNGLSDLTSLTSLTLSGSRGPVKSGTVDLTKLQNLTTLTVEAENPMSYSDVFSYSAVSGLPNLTTVLGAANDMEEIATLPALTTISFPYSMFHEHKTYDRAISVRSTIPDMTIQW